MSKKQFAVVIVYILFFVYLAWWLWMYLVIGEYSELNDYFTDTYGVLALVSAIFGMLVSKKWGFLKSYVGKAIFLISLGLFFQFLGQASYTFLYYVYGIENAYPSFGEIFYLLSIPCYVIGVWFVGKSSGYDLTIRSTKNKIITYAMPAVLMFMSYYVFLNNYDFESSPLLNTFLDFFYPLGQASFLALALMVLVKTSGLLGGIMRKRIWFILASLIFQYFADSLFIFENQSGTWIPGGHSDVLFLTSYFLMGLSVLMFTGIEQDLGKHFGEINGKN